MLLYWIWTIRHISWDFFNMLWHWFRRGWYRPFTFENIILSYGLRWWPGNVPTTLYVVLGPCAQCCPCEASEQKMGQKLKAIPNAIELSFISFRLAFFDPFFPRELNTHMGSIVGTCPSSQLIAFQKWEAWTPPP